MTEQAQQGRTWATGRAQGHFLFNNFYKEIHQVFAA